MGQKAEAFVGCINVQMYSLAVGAFPIIFLGVFSRDSGSGGQFDIPYFFCGYVGFGMISINIIFKCVLLDAIKKYGGTKKDILRTFSTNIWVNTIWPLTAAVGAAYFVSATLLIGFSGVNCSIVNNTLYNITDAQQNFTEIVKNTCYYDIEDENSGKYRTMAVFLMVLHVLAGFIIALDLFVRIGVDDIENDPVLPATPQPLPPTTDYERAVQRRIDALEEREKALRTKVERVERLISGEITASPEPTPPALPPPPSYQSLWEDPVIVHPPRRIRPTPSAPRPLVPSREGPTPSAPTPESQHPSPT